MAKSMRNAMIRISSMNNTQNGIIEYTKRDINKMMVEWSATCNMTYWWIEHKADDEVSQTHYHIVIKFKNPMPFDNIKSHVPYGDIEQARSIKACVQYLIHLNDKSKVQYEWRDISTNCQDMTPYKILTNSQAEITIQGILDRIDRGEIREYNQFIEIPIEIWAKHKSRIENGLTYYRERIYMDKNREIAVVFMSGATGVGKTTFAKQYCEKAGKSYCVSSTSNDPMQDYKGEDVLILDDLRDSDYKFTDLLKILDNHTKTTMKARYHNKAFIGDMIIITSYKPLNDWYYDIQRESKEQLYRRIKTQYKFYENEIQWFEFDEQKHRYELIGTLPNIITMSSRKKAQTGLDMIKAMGLKFEPATEKEVRDYIDNLSDEELDFVVADNSDNPFK